VEEDRKAIEKRMRMFMYVVVLLFAILISRLAYMQLFENDKYSTLASENRMRFIPISAPRGEIFDKDLVKLVGNQPVFTVYLDSVVLKNLEQSEIESMQQRLSDLLGLSVQDLQESMKHQERYYEPIKVMTEVSPELVISIEEQRFELPGVFTEIAPLREYPQGALLAHVLGYVRQIDEAQLERNRDKGYAPGDPYGQSGLENSYEQYLRGQNGGRQVEVDAMARPVRDLGVKKPIPGHNLILTIDRKVQRATEEALAEASRLAIREGFRDARAGSAVVIDVNTGAVLAMASYPSYNPDALSGFLSQEDYAEIFESPAKPMLNRAVSLTYAPGSTFKMIVAMAGLETGSVTPQTTISCSGVFHWDGGTFEDWRLGGHGTVSLNRAIKVSCNPYFYRLGLDTGIDNIARYCREFGLGIPTGIELPGEIPGVIPHPDSKLQTRIGALSSEKQERAKEIEKRYKEPLANAANYEERRQLLRNRSRELMEIEWELAWHDYNTVISSIGQGDSRFNPLELANHVAAIANGGTVYKPYLVKRIEDSTGQLILENKPEVLNQADVSENTLDLVRRGMREVTLPPDGTAPYFANLPPVAAKTGTAEVQGRDNHALIVAFAPYDNPEIALAIVLEYGGRGGAMTGAAARDIFRAYFYPEEEE